MQNKILTIGPITKDIIITPQSRNSQTGGSVFYQSKALHLINTPHDVVLTIADDDLKLLNSFDSQENIKTIITKQTMQYTNIYDESMQRTQKATLPENPIGIDNIKDINLSQYHTAIISPLCEYDIPPETIKYLKQNNLKTTIVAQGYLRSTDKDGNIKRHEWNNKDAYLKYADTIILDDEETKKAFNLNEITDDNINEILKKYDIETFIITKASKGSTIYMQDIKTDIPCIKAEKIVDPTGLGDTYIAAYTSKIMENKSVYEAGIFAAEMAKEKIEIKYQ